VRVFVDYANLKLRFAPLVQTDSSPAKLLAGMSRGSTTDPLSELLITAVRPSDGREDTLRAGVHRAIVFALSCHLGVLAWSSIRRSELADTFANSIPDLMIEDATFLLGEQLAERVTELVQGYMRNPYYRSSLTFNSGGRTFRDTKQSNKTNIDSSGPLLRGTIISRLRRGDNLVPSSKRDAFENISYMIPTMTTVIDKEARSEDDSGRLLRGLTFSDFLILLNDDGVQTTENELSTALDELVDGGSLVPQLMVDVEKATIARAYRSGESAPANSTMVLRSIIQSLLKERLLAGLRPLSEIGFSKVFVILKLLTPKLPYRIGLRPFGCEPILDDGLLREWCYNHRIAELADDKGRKVVVAVDHPAPPSAWPMPGLEGVNLRDAFDYIAELDGLAAASSEDAPGLKMLILLSTCNTHQATFNACAWEMHAWLRFRDSNKDYNFDRVLSLLEAVNWEQVTLEAETRAAAQQPSLFDERSTKALVGPIRANLVAKSFRRIKLTTLYKHCRDYLSQYRFKRNIFYVDSSSIVASLGRHFASERSRYRFWQELFINDKRLDLGVNPMYQKLFDIMDPLEEAAWALMDIVQQVLVATESWPDDSSPTSTATFVDGINCYNRAIGLLHAVGKEAGRLKPFDTDAVVSESQIGKWVYECRLRFEELKTAFGFWIPIFDELSATPFSPGIFRKSRYVEDDLLRNHYLGMFDMLNSKISATEVKEQIARVMDEIGCFHEVTGNDCCLFVTETLTKAIEVVEAVRVRTVQYVNADGKGFGGVRAAITKGDCLKRRLSGTTLDDARLMLMDMDGTPDIPNTSYLLDRIKELLAQHSSLKVSDQTRGIAVDREIAIEYGGTTNDVELENKGLSNVGQWTVKTVSGEAYFYIPLE
jgi:hypothetical protein